MRNIITMQIPKYICKYFLRSSRCLKSHDFFHGPFFRHGSIFNNISPTSFI